MTHETRRRLDALISEEAAEWFVEFRTGDIDAAGRREFDGWLRASPEHLRAYLEVSAIWNESGSLATRRAPDIDALIALADSPPRKVVLLESGVQPSPRKAGAPGKMWKRRASLAAALFVVLTGSALLSWRQLYGAPEYSTAVGEQRSLRLSDGSTVELNSRSKLRVRFTRTQRVVELLEGQALFHVARNVARPFIVRSAQTSVRAVGTRFDVYRKRSGTVVTVLEGRVAVSRGFPTRPGSGDAAHASRGSGRSADTLVAPVDSTGSVSMQKGSPDVEGVLLSAGEQLAVTPRATTRPTRADVAAATAWTQHRLILDAIPLAQVAEEFNRYSARKLIVEDHGVPELRLSGVFTTNPDFLIRYLRERPDVVVSETSTDVRIVRRP